VSSVLAGKTALVVGASQGIGLACAKVLAQDGVNVILMGRGHRKLEHARSTLMSAVPGADIRIFAGDACNEESMKAAVEFACSTSPHLDILVTAVGGANFYSIANETVASVRESLDRNFMSVFLPVHNALPRLQRGAAIVCISTNAVTQSYKGLSIYSAAKAAVERFIRVAAYEFGSAGIRINAVRPGVTLTAESVERLGMTEFAKKYAAKIPMGRIGAPDDIASVVRFLAGPESAWVTGQTFSADGGEDQCRTPEFI